MGRCLKKSEDQPGVYKERSAALPKFDAETRGTLPASPTLPASRSLIASQPSLFSRLVAAPAEEEILTGAPEKKAATPGAIAPKPAPAVPARPLAPLSPVLSAPRKEAKWKSMIKGLFGFRSKRPVERRVQAELSLDRVTVKRNDLNDSDLEVVARRPQSADTTPLISFERRQTQSWMKLTKRLFHPANGTAPAAAQRSPFATSKPAPELIARS